MLPSVNVMYLRTGQKLSAITAQNSGLISGKIYSTTHQCFYSVFQSASHSTLKCKRYGSTAKQN